MDDSSIQKVWERPWSTEEMRAHCSNWNLAGDAGLLKHIQEFSQNLMQKTHTAEVALDSLLEDMRNTSVDVQNATNALLMLSNNQFVENRVYDDCEDEKEEMEAKGEGGDGARSAVSVEESTLIAKAAEAISLGMSVIDTKFDCVEVPASDSEGEEDVQNTTQAGRKSFALVLEPRNPYALQPLPHLIGSKEFMEDDRVGLGGEEEEEEEDVHSSVGQDLATQGLNDSGSSLTGDMGDEGLFDEDEVDDRRVPKTSVKQSWESLSSNGSDDLVVENNVIRKKVKKKKVKNALAQDDAIMSFGNEGDDIFGGKGSSSGDEFMVPTPKQAKTSSVPKGEEEDLDGDVTSNHRRHDAETKGTSEGEGASPVTNTRGPIPPDNLFGPPKDDWKEDDDRDSIFAATDGIFSGGRGLFDDFEDPFKTSNRRAANQFQPPSLPDRPPAFEGEEASAHPEQESKGDIFGDEGDDEDVFANILTKVISTQQKQNKIKEELPKKPPAVPENTKGKQQKKGVDSEETDSWLFNEDDQEDALWSTEVNPKKQIVHDEVPVMPPTYSIKSQDDDEMDEESKDAVQSKLPVGARSFYSGGVDPFALGKKLTKEIESKQKKKEGKESGVGVDVIGKKAAPEQNVNPELKEEISGKKSVKRSKNSPDSGSLFDDVDEEDDLFAPVSSKANKAKDAASSNKGDLFGDTLFAPKKASLIPPKTSEAYRQPEKKVSSVDVDKNKNLFGDFDDNGDIFSGSNSLGSGSSTSKPLSCKEGKVFIDVPDPLFEDILRKDEELFPGSLEKNIFSETEVEDDLFSGFTKTEHSKSIKSKKKESSSSIKTEFRVPLDSDSKDSGPVEPGKINQFSKDETSDDLFGPIGVTSSKKNDAKPLKKTEASHGSRDKPLPRKKIKNEFDDIFGDSDDNATKVDATKNGPGAPNVDAMAGVVVEETRKNSEVKRSVKPDKESKLKNLFDDFGNDDDIYDFLSSRKHAPSKSVKASDSLFDSNSFPKKVDSKDLCNELDSDGDGQKFSTPKGGRVKEDPLFVDDPLGEDLFSTLKPPVTEEIPAPSLPKDEESLVFSVEPDREKTEESSSKGVIKACGKEDGRLFGKHPTSADENSAPLVPSVRRSPPKTLNLEKVIPSPKPESQVPVGVDGSPLFGSTDVEDERIVEAWMKGHPPPLRDSKVETDMDDDDITPAQSHDDFEDGDLRSSYFAGIPSASLLHSHGKERARIQGHRRPPSRKARKGSAASVDPLPTTIEGKEKPMEAALPSRDSVEEDGGSQSTIEEWSTPEAALNPSPPRTNPPSAPPPLSNPLSPSTDEEQDFFDVLPVGRYPSSSSPPPPMHPHPPPSSSLSPFSDAVVENVWDKDDGALFEDAQPMEQGGGGLWGPGGPPSAAPPRGDGGWTPTAELPEHSGNDESGRKASPPSSGGVEGRRGEKGNGFYSRAEWGPFGTGGKSVSAQDGSLPKKGAKAQGKQDLEKLDDDLWGNGVSSKLKGDIFAEDLDSLQSGDFDDIFEGQGDLFGPSKMSASKSESKRVAKGSGSGSGMGKSLSKLDSKAKAPASLFDDEDDTEDLFSPHAAQPASRKGSNTTKKTTTTKPAVSEQPSKSSRVKVAVNDDSIFEDPLMVLKRKD